MYKVTSDYHILKNVGCVQMWFINGLPFTFEEIDNPDIDLIEACQEVHEYTLEELYHISQYLIMEECHPLVFEINDLLEGVQDEDIQY